MDVWQDVFYTYCGYWIRVACSDGRQLVGWPPYFSAVGQPRGLFVADAKWWLTSSDGAITSEDVGGEGVYSADFSAVRAITLVN